MSYGELMERVEQRMTELSSIYARPKDYLNTQADELGDAVFHSLDPRTAHGFMAGFIAGQESAFENITPAPDAPPEEGRDE